MRINRRRPGAGRRVAVLGGCAALVAAAVAAVPGALAAVPSEAAAVPSTFKPIDAQVVQDQDDMTWDDYRPIPNTNWVDPNGIPSEEGLRILLVAVDFRDQPFVITQPKFSDPFGNPQIDPIAREDVPEFYRDYYMKPSALNHQHTIHEYWMEQTRGQFGVTQMDVAGPYRMPKFLYQYGLNEFNQNAPASNACPAQTTATGAQTATTNLAVGTTDFFYAGDVISIQGVSGTRTVSAVADATHLTLTTPATVADGARVHDCAFNLDTDVNAAFRADLGCTGNCGYDVVLRIYAGYDETSVWQEFGEMKFQTQFDIPDEWGNPNPLLPNWSITRYVPWTSWLAGSQQWGLSSIRQGESSGTITHEMGHFFFSIGDNNNNPFVQPYHRVGSAPWDMMDRGSFNGPGGHHMRWVVPANMGAWMPAGLLLRNKIVMDVLPPENILLLNREGLADSGPVVAKVTARAVDPGLDGLSGIRIALDGTPVDRTPACDVNTDPFCHGNTGWNHFTVEVSQRIGYDSYTPDNGVLIAKNKTGSGNTCGYSCFNWVIDANPQDMNMVDYFKPDGTPVMRTIADHRQLNDAAFHAGTNSGSEYEWVDEPNRLHFYVIDRFTDKDGVLTYQVAVRSLDGSGPQARGVDLRNGKVGKRARNGWNTCTFDLENTGEEAATPDDAHPEIVDGYLRHDIYRVSATVAGEGWTTEAYNALATAKFGRNVDVPVYVTREAQGSSTAVVTLTARSESDPTKVDTATCTVRAGDLG